MDDATVRSGLVDFLNTVVRPGQNVTTAGDETNLIDAGVIDSLALIQIIYYLETDHGLKLHTLGIDPSDLASIGGILNAIARARA